MIASYIRKEGTSEEKNFKIATKSIRAFLTLQNLVRVESKFKVLSFLLRDFLKCVNFLDVIAAFLANLSEEIHKGATKRSLFYFPYFSDFLNMVDDDERLLGCIKLFLAIREAADIRDERLDDIIAYKVSEKYGESIFQDSSLSTQNLTPIPTNPLVSKV